MMQAMLETYLNDGVLMVFASPIDEVFKCDALDASLYAQLAASKQFNRFSDHPQWRATLIKALTTFGWLRLDFEDHHGVEGDTFGLVDVLRRRLPRALVSHLGSKLDTLFTWLFTDEGNKVVNAMVERRSGCTVETEHAETLECVTSVVLQVAFVLPSREQVLVCIAFDTRQTIDTQLFAQQLFKRQLVGEIDSFVWVGELDDLRYSLHRERIAEALSDKRATCSFLVKGLGS